MEQKKRFITHLAIFDQNFFFCYKYFLLTKSLSHKKKTAKIYSYKSYYEFDMEKTTTISPLSKKMYN